MNGTIVNVLAIVIGGLIGFFFGTKIRDNIKNTVMQALSLGVLVIGIQMSLKVEDTLMVIISLVLGGIIGEVLQIEMRLEQAGKWLEKKLGENYGQVAKAFVTTSLLYCVGAMAVVGAIENGLTGNASTLYAKSLIDGTTAVFFASTMGIGVIFSAIPVFIYQGTIAVFATSLKGVLSTGVINQVTATGGILIIGIGINLLTNRNIRVGNMLPAVLVVALITIVREFM